MNKWNEKASIFIFFSSFILTYQVVLKFLQAMFKNNWSYPYSNIDTNLTALLVLFGISVILLFIPKITNKFLFFKYNAFFTIFGILQFFLFDTISNAWRPYGIEEYMLVIVFSLIALFIFFGSVSYLISFVFYLRYKKEYTFTQIIRHKDVYNSKGIMNGSLYFMSGVAILIATLIKAFMGFDEPPMFSIFTLTAHIFLTSGLVYLYINKRDTMTLFALITSSVFLIYFTYFGFIRNEVLFYDLNETMFAAFMYSLYGFILVMLWLIIFRFFGEEKNAYNRLLLVFTLTTLLHFVTIQFVERQGVIYFVYRLEYIMFVVMTTVAYSFIVPITLEIINQYKENKGESFE